MPIIRSGYTTRRRNGSTRAYRNARTTTLNGATTCWLCGQPARTDDPLEADHVVPWAAGGHDGTTNLAPAHRSCNNQRSSLQL